MAIALVLAVLAIGYFLKEDMCISTGELLLRGAVFLLLAGAALYVVVMVIYAVVTLVLVYAALLGAAWVIGAVIQWVSPCFSDAAPRGAEPESSSSSLVTPGNERNNFSYECRNGRWRAYFVGMPTSQAHVLRDGSRHYVCWSDPLRTKEEAKRVAAEWERHYE